MPFSNWSGVLLDLDLISFYLGRVGLGYLPSNAWHQLVRHQTSLADFLFPSSLSISIPSIRKPDFHNIFHLSSQILKPSSFFSYFPRIRNRSFTFSQYSVSHFCGSIYSMLGSLLGLLF